MMKHQSDKTNKILAGVGIVSVLAIGVFVMKKNPLNWIALK